jgi:hypothetical protein
MNISPAERLAVSREHLRVALLREPGAAGPAGSDPSGEARSDPARQAGFDDLRSLPGVKLVIEAIGLWWNRHPLRATSLLAAEAAKAVIAPVAQRHPLLLVAGAVVVGGLLARSRPWRWGFSSALFAGLLPQLLATSLSHWRRHSDANAGAGDTSRPQPSVRASKNA